MRAYTERAQRPSSNLMSRTNSSVNVDIQTIKQRKEATVNKGCTEGITSYISKYRRNIFWLTLYTLVSFGIFIERAYYYSVNREHGGLRRLAGYGVSITRGA